MKKISLSLLFLFALSFVSFAQDFKGIKVAIVNMNEALNSSERGKKSRDLLEAKNKKIEAQLKVKEDKILQVKKDLENSLLSEDARKKRVPEFEALQKDYFAERQKLEQDLRGDEQKYTETIFKELKGVVEQIAKKKGLDLVIEYSLSTAILYSSGKAEDITAEVIKTFNDKK